MTNLKKNKHYYYLCACYQMPEVVRALPMCLRPQQQNIMRALKWALILLIIFLLPHLSNENKSGIHK